MTEKNEVIEIPCEYIKLVIENLKEKHKDYRRGGQWDKVIKTEGQILMIEEMLYPLSHTDTENAKRANELLKSCPTMEFYTK